MAHGLEVGLVSFLGRLPGIQFDPGVRDYRMLIFLHDFGFFHAETTRLISYAKTENNLIIDGAIRLESTKHLPGECFLKMSVIASSVLYQSVDELGPCFGITCL
jgi:hypothetical protein